MRKIEPPYIHKKFLFIWLIKKETVLEMLLKKHPVPWQVVKDFKSLNIEPYKLDFKGFLRITPVPWKHHLDLDKLKKIINEQLLLPHKPTGI